MARKTTGAQAADQTRHRLLGATERLVVSTGVVSLSVRRIANEAEVNSALIRYHFGDMQGLLRELALLNAAQLRDARDRLLDALEAKGAPDFEAAVDALVLPLWAPTAMSPDERAVVVLDEIYARAGTALHDLIWAEFSEGVRRVTDALRRALGEVDEAGLAWRIRFVTAAALDIPPRSARVGEHPRSPIYGLDSAGERLAQFRRFALQALRVV
ncbi:MAG: TetR family transcriptional regulator [Sphingobium sp.]|nr:TetR family transcriptional regulator [Sphingobium sp.]